eukprot:3276588-Prymnesium_polylepis.1
MRTGPGRNRWNRAETKILKPPARTPSSKSCARAAICMLCFLSLFAGVFPPARASAQGHP